MITGTPSSAAWVAGGEEDGEHDPGGEHEDAEDARRGPSPFRACGRTSRFDIASSMQLLAHLRSSARRTCSADRRASPRRRPGTARRRACARSAGSSPSFGSLVSFQSCLNWYHSLSTSSIFEVAAHREVDDRGGDVERVRLEVDERAELAGAQVVGRHELDRGLVLRGAAPRSSGASARPSRTRRRPRTRRSDGRARTSRPGRSRSRPAAREQSAAERRRSRA